MPIVGLNDFHGQLDPTTLAYDNGLNARVGGGAFLATMFDEELAALPGRGLLLAGGDNVGASPPNSALLEDMPAIDVENAWGLDATSYGNHEFDYGLDRLLAHQERADFPFLATNIVRENSRRTPDWVTPSKVFRVNGVRVGVIGAALEETPELVSAGATEGLAFLDEARRDRRRVPAAGQARRRGPGRRRPRGHGHRQQRRRQHPGASRGTARSSRSPTGCRPPRWTRWSSATRTGSRT